MKNVPLTYRPPCCPRLRRPLHCCPLRPLHQTHVGAPPGQVLGSWPASQGPSHPLTKGSNDSAEEDAEGEAEGDGDGDGEGSGEGEGPGQV